MGRTEPSAAASLEKVDEAARLHVAEGVLLQETELAAEPEFDVTVVNHFVEQAADDLLGLLGLQATH